MGRLTKVDRAKKKAAVTKVTEVTKVTQPEKPEQEYANAFSCMDCGREMSPVMQRFTVKYQKGGITVVCPICAGKKGIRLKTPYISYDAKRFLNVEKERV